MKKKRNFLLKSILLQLNFSLEKAGILLVLVLVFSIQAKAYSQTRITAKRQGVTIDEVLKEVREKSGYRFLYRVEEVNRYGKRDIDVKDAEVEDFLGQLLQNTDLTYEVENEVIIIRPEKQRQDSRVNVQVVRGKVTDENNLALPGATVLLKGTSYGVVTDSHGKFTMEVLERDTVTLLVSFVGMETRLVNLKKGQTEILVSLEPDIKEMKEVVVTGYGNVRKTSFTGNSVTVTKDELMSVSKSNVIKALQTFDPSFRIQTNNDWGSDPNALPEMYVRGRSGISGVKELDRDPLTKSALKDNPNLPTFIMDGFQISVEQLYDMDPNRIESITILKDAAATAAHWKTHEAEEDNAAVEGAHRAELAGESLARKSIYTRERLKQRREQSKRLKESVLDEAEKSRLMFEAVYGNEAKKMVKKEAEQKRKSALQKLFQKKRYQKQYQAAKQSKKAKDAAITSAQKFTEKAKDAVKMIVAQNRGIFATVAIFGLIFVLIAASFTSCSASLQGASSAIISTSYSSTDEDIYAAENAYRALEEALNTQINQMESTHPDYDEYRYQIDEIGHNPYQLISYLTVKYGGFTYDEVAEEIESIFRQQYGITTDSTRETVTETKTVRVGESLGQVVTSGYCNCSICCGQWSGGPTASGAMPTANHTIAVDASNPFVPMGTHVIMNGVEYVVEDTGAFARYGVQFDVYYDNHAAASAHGHQTWEAYIADSNGSQEVQVTTTKEVNRLDVTMTNRNLDTILRSRMTEEEQERYDAYNKYYGNRDYLFDLNSIPTGSGGFGYTIPTDALSDPQFAKMIQEAEKYLGVPYVWGGYSPSGFDCSGFVSWVINNCGNGWNVGRCTADGLRSHCSQVSPSEAKPGDLIFFQGTYNTPGASHVGIYVGNNMMIHCGKPVQYTSIASAYWQEHFMAFGRLH